MGRLGRPADIGNAVSLLCMDEASFITGQLYVLAGYEGQGQLDIMPLGLTDARVPANFLLCQKDKMGGCCHVCGNSELLRCFSAF